MNYIWSVVPLLTIIAVSLWTKQVLIGLVLGLTLGAWILSPGLIPMLDTTLKYLYMELVIPDNLHLLVFLYLFGVLVGLLRASGGIHGFIQILSPWMRTQRRAYGVLWLTSLWTVMAPDFRIMAVGPLIKIGMAKNDKELFRAGSVLTATATPLAALLPLGTLFVGYMVGLCTVAAKTVHYSGSPYSLFLKTLPLNFFAWAILAWAIWRSFFNFAPSSQSGASLQKESRLAWNGEWGAIGEPLRSSALAPRVDNHLDHSLTRAHPASHFIIPMFLLWSLTIAFTLLNGFASAKTPFQALLQADAGKAMMQALVATLLLTIPFLWLRGVSIEKIVQASVNGGNEMMPVLLLLILVWAVSAIATGLGFSEFITSSLGRYFPSRFIVPALFLIGAILSYFLGSTFGVWGLLMPLAVSFATATGASLVMLLAAVFAGGTFGGFASPLSDNTAALAMVLDRPVMELSKNLLRPALLAGGLALIMFAVFGY